VLSIQTGIFEFAAQVHFSNFNLGILYEAILSHEYGKIKFAFDILKGYFINLKNSRSISVSFSNITLPSMFTFLRYFWLKLE
jgi:hypothetical protein